MLILNRIKRLLPHPVAKRLAVAIPFTLSILLIRLWAGYEPSALIGLLSGIGAYAAADYLLCTQQEYRGRLRSMREGCASLVGEHAGEIVSVILCVAVFAATFGNLGMPKEAVVREVMSLVRFFGPVAFLFYVLVLTISVSGTAFTMVIERAAMFVAAYGTALWLIGEIGDRVYRWALENPGDAASGLVAAAIVLMILWISSGRRSAQPEYIVLSCGKVQFAPLPWAIRRDARYTAAHEAGHALVYAALGRLPVDMKVVISDRPGADGLLGFVTGIHDEHRPMEKRFAEWHMLVCLAGEMGESMLGETTLCGSDDHLRWLDIAHLYLSNHCRGVYYGEPQTKFEREQHEAKLEALQQEQMRTLKSLFDLNTEVFRRLADALLEKRALTRDDLIPFLARVKLPDGFPLPFGPFVEFSTEWPEDSHPGLRWRRKRCLGPIGMK